MMHRGDQLTLRKPCCWIRLSMKPHAIKEAVGKALAGQIDKFCSSRNDPYERQQDYRRNDNQPDGASGPISVRHHCSLTIPTGVWISKIEWIVSEREQRAI